MICFHSSGWGGAGKRGEKILGKKMIFLIGGQEDDC